MEQNAISATESIVPPEITKQEIHEFFNLQTDDSPIPIPVDSTPFLFTEENEKKDQNENVLPQTSSSADSTAAANRWKCQFQYMRKHPTQFTKILTYLLASLILWICQQTSQNKDKDLKRIDKGIAVTATILHSYLMAFITLYLTINIFFLFVLSQDMQFGITDSFPNVESRFGMDLQKERGSFKYWLFFLSYAPYYIFHHLMDVFRPQLAKQATQSAFVFTAVFALTFVFFQMNLLSFDRGLEFLRFEVPSAQSMMNGNAMLWTVALLTLLSAFIEFVVRSRPTFSSFDFVKNPQQALETWITHIVTPASNQYLKIVLMFFVAVLVWIPFGLFLSMTLIVFFAWLGIILFSNQPFFMTWSKIWNYKGKMVQRLFSGLFAGLASINLKDSIENIRHTTAGPTMAVINTVILSFSLLMFVLSFLEPKKIT